MMKSLVFLVLLCGANMFFAKCGFAQVEDVLIITSEGKIGITTSTPVHLFHFGLGAYTDGKVWFTSTKLADMATDIEVMTDEFATSALNGLTPKILKYSDEDPAKPFPGFIVEELPGEIAASDATGYSTAAVVAVLTKVMKMQQQKIEELELALESLRDGVEVEGAPPVRPVVTSEVRIPDGCTVYLPEYAPDKLSVRYNQPEDSNQMIFGRVYKVDQTEEIIVKSEVAYARTNFPLQYDSEGAGELGNLPYPHFIWNEKTPNPVVLAPGIYFHYTNCFGIEKQGMLSVKAPSTTIYKGCAVELPSPGTDKPVFSFKVDSGIHSPSISIYYKGLTTESKVESNVSLFAKGEKELSTGTHEIGLDHPTFWRGTDPPDQITESGQYFYFIDDCSNDKTIEGIIEKD